MSITFDKQPLDIESFPSNLQKHVQPSSPPPLKMMAARGMVPAPPDQLLRVLYQLHFEDAIRAEVTKSLTDMPDNVLIPALQADQPAGVLDWIAHARGGAALDAIVLHKNVDDITIASISSTCSAAVCDIIANNEVRVLRAPVIIEQLYLNSNARMATVDRLIDLARRNDIKLNNLPGLQAALDSGEDIFEGGATDDDAFAAVLQNEAAKVLHEEKKLAQLEDDELTRSERERMSEEMEKEEAENAEKRTGTLHSQISTMSIAQKVRLSTVGSRDAINILVRDANKLIHMAAIRSPRLRIGDIKKFASNKSLPEGVIKYIASNKDWTRHYEIMVSLVINPKTPLSDTMGFLNHMRSKELRDLSRNRNVAQQVSRMAKSLASKRTGR